jgi:hypothetical protein
LNPLSVLLLSLWKFTVMELVMLRVTFGFSQPQCFSRRVFPLLVSVMLTQS